MSWRRAARFHEQLASLLDAGLALDRALLLAGTAAGGMWRRDAGAWAAACRGGRPLSLAMTATRADPFAIALVRAGEAGGALPACCRHLAGLYSAWDATRRDLIGRLAYPTLVLHGALVAPALPPVLTGNAPGALLLAGPGGLWLVALIIAGIGILLRRGGTLDRLALLPPAAWLMGPLLTANLARALQAALAAGLRVGESFALAADACGNRLLAQRLAAAGRTLEEHRRHGIADALAACGMASDWADLLRAGEASGALDRTLGQVAGLASERFAGRLAWTTRLTGALAYALAIAATLAAVMALWNATYGAALQGGGLDG